MNVIEPAPARTSSIGSDTSCPAVKTGVSERAVFFTSDGKLTLIRLRRQGMGGWWGLLQMPIKGLSRKVVPDSVVAMILQHQKYRRRSRKGDRLDIESKHHVQT